MSYEGQEVFEDAEDGSDYGDAEDDPEVAEPECSHCHRMCRYLMDQEPEIRVFNLHVCNCRFVCEECVNRGVRRDRTRCRVCRQVWRNIEFDPPITYEQFLQANNIEIFAEYTALSLGTAAAVRLFIKYYPRFQTRMTQMKRYTSGDTNFDIIVDYFLFIWVYCWGLFSLVVTYLFILDVFRAIIRNYVLPLCYRLYRPFSRQDFHVIDP